MPPAPTFAELLLRCLESFQITEHQARALSAHYGLLMRWNKTLNLTRITDPEEAAVRHYGESLFLARLLPSGPLSVLDVGSGAGFPGFPIAVVRPECRVMLCESQQRKAVFLREATRELSNVVVIVGRAEEVDTSSVEWVVSRAVAPTEVVPLAKHGIALLIGEEDVMPVMQERGVAWNSPVLLPWGKKRIALLGHRE